MDNLLSIETDNLAREVLITLKREGLPPKSHWHDMMAPYALMGWDAASDAIAWATLAKIANSEWDKTFAYADDENIETVAQDVGDNAIEGLVVIDAKTGDTLFDRTGVVRADGSQYVGMQDTEADALLAEALSGRDLIFVHNHTEEIGASDEDLDSAFAAGAKLLIVITPRGQEFVYIRGKYGMVKVRDEQASYEVGQENREETKKLRIRSEAQAWAFQVDTPELIFLQEEPLWWKQDNVPVTYITSETMAQVAARMGIPVEQLQELNPGGVTKGVMRIPLPGWHTQIISDSNGRWLSAKHFTGATFLDFDDPPEIDQIVARWESLSLVEQQIEMALIGSNANVSGRVPFANRYGFDDTLTWIHDREDDFKQAAIDFDIPVAPLKTVIQSELLYDYDAQDQFQDDVIRANFNLLGRRILWPDPRFRDSWDGAGVANVHYPTLYDAYHHLKTQLEPGETHPWHRGSIDSPHIVPNLISAPELPVSTAEVSEWHDGATYNDLEPWQIETAEFALRMDRLNEVPRDLRIEIAHYLADDTGSVRAAAMVVRMIIDQLRDLDSNANACDSPRDMAKVWGRYRSSEEYFDYAGNARLAHPLANYWSTQEYEKEEK